MSAYAAYEQGFLPTSGGMDDQPALFFPIVSTIKAAVSAEADLAKATDKGRDKIVQQSAPGKGKKPGSVSLLNGPTKEDAPGFRRL